VKEMYKNIIFQEKDGLTIPSEFIREADLGSSVFITVQRHLIMIKPMSLTDKMRGLVRNATLTSTELDELYMLRG